MNLRPLGTLDRAGDGLLAVEAVDVDALAPEALPAFIAQAAALQAQAAALQARAAARLAIRPANSRGAHDGWLTADEAAAWLKVPRRWIYTHREALGGAHVGRYVRFERSRVDAALRRMQEES